MNKDTQKRLVKEMAALITQGAIPMKHVSVPTRTSMHSDEMGNVLASADLLAWIRTLEDFDLIMLLSEVDQHGWDEALRTIECMKDAGVGQ